MDAWEALDTAILKILPDEGAMRGKYLPLTMSAKALANALDDPETTTMRLGRRLAAMHKQDLVRPYEGVEGKHTWQRTAKGKERAEA